MGLRTRRTRTQPVRLALAIMLAVPLTSLVALWAFAAVTTLATALEQAKTENVNGNVDPAATDLLNSLDTERAQSFVWLSAARQIPRTPMDNSRATTSFAVADFRNVLERVSGDLPAAARSDLTALFTKLDGLHTIRSQIDSGTRTAFGAFQQYNAIVDSAFQWFVSASSGSGSNVGQLVANLGVARASELGGREATLLDAALVTRGHLTSDELRAFKTDAIIRRDLLDTQLSHLGGAVRGVYKRVYSSSPYRDFVAAEDLILADANSKAPVPVNAVAWQETSTSVLLQLRDAGAHAGAILSKESTRTGNANLLRLGLAAGLGLVAVVASIFVLLKFGGRISRELTRLHAAAQKLANERLPRVVERLSRGYDVDVNAEAPPIDSAKTREIAKVGQAFGNVQRTAVSAAVGQAELRRGISDVYLNLARRNQSLLHRQLSMLDTMERRDNEPEALADLFRLDHLTTRMRRHAESLIILSGAVPARGWRSPVRMVDILRAAIAEVEDYTRIKLVTQSRDGVIGAVVTDIIHLLAELIENAAAFSPPNTPVTVTADRVANGFVVEIEDRGLGLDPDELQRINERMANPPDFNMARSERLGLFVVGRLAARHGIKITLRPSPYGGTTAIVLMPNRIIAPDGVAGALGNGGQALTSSGDDGGLADSDGADSGANGSNGNGSGARPGDNGAPGAEPAQAPIGLTGRHRTRLGPDIPGGPGDTSHEGPGSPRVVQGSSGSAEPPSLARQGVWPQPGTMFRAENLAPFGDPDAPPNGGPAPAPAAPGTDSPGGSPPFLTPGSQLGDETLTAPVEAETLPHGWQAPGPATAPPGPPTGPHRGVPGGRPSGPAPPGDPSGPAQWGAPAGQPSELAQQGGEYRSGAASAGTHMGLPRRVRQANLAPQLRDAQPYTGFEGPRQQKPEQARSAEETRDLMNRMQRGWVRGRADAERHNPPTA
jgi:signal transduction histidine kinase